MFSLRQGQSRPIYDALEGLRAGDAWSSLDAAQQRIAETLLRDMRHSGVGLADAERDRFNEIAQELAEISTSFSNHVLDATTAFSLVLRDRADLDGLPQNAIELAAQSARESGEEGATAADGPWRITLDFPSFHPFMENSTRRDLREQLYRAYVTRASAGELDNTPLIERILVLRAEQARLLGYADYAELSLSAKMATDVDAVTALLERLRRASFESARDDLSALAGFARERGAPEADSLAQWDIAYWSERLREHRYAYSEEALRPYFPLPKVLAGLFSLAQRLLGVTIEPADGEAPIWHDDVRFFRVRDAQGQPIASFYLDPYSRSGEKRGGAWMDECVGRALASECPGWAQLQDGVRLPVAHLVCNQTPPVGDRPSLMSFDEVRTLFHEFGHGLQHMLTRVDYGLAAGIRNIEWDAVELPSQFMENWCYHRETLDEISEHVDTGEALPDELYQKLLAARTYRAGSDMLRQLYFALTDLELHRRSDPTGASAFDIQRRVAETTTVLPPLAEDRFLCSFGHIFAGGYAAGYYSYKWAEVCRPTRSRRSKRPGSTTSRASARQAAVIATRCSPWAAASLRWKSSRLPGTRAERRRAASTLGARGLVSADSKAGIGRPRRNQRVYSVVRQIPRGRVATYGQIARLAGLPGGARQVGYALHQLPEDESVPWQRVVNARGEVSARALAGMEQIQRQLLEAEGLEFDPSGRLDLARFLWRPRRSRIS